MRWAVSNYGEIMYDTRFGIPFVFVDNTFYILQKALCLNIIISEGLYETN